MQVVVIRCRRRRQGESIIRDLILYAVFKNVYYTRQTGYRL